MFAETKTWHATLPLISALCFIPLSPDSDPYLISPNNNTAWSNGQIMRMNEMIAKDENVVMLELILSSSTIQYASAVFADLPKYLACYLENVQKRALSIIWPGILYETALDKAALSTLSDFLAVSCTHYTH